MRTGSFLLAGFLLLTASFLLARLFAGYHSASATLATLVFLLMWFAIAALNMWTGVAKAGYAWAEELPIFLLIFGVPAVIALLLKWKVF